jgi:hypothetical protein
MTAIRVCHHYLKAYQMQDVNADIASLYALNCYQEDIACNIPRVLTGNNLLPVRVLQVNSLSSHLSWFR